MCLLPGVAFLGAQRVETCLGPDGGRPEFAATARGVPPDSPPAGGGAAGLPTCGGGAPGLPAAPAFLQGAEPMVRREAWTQEKRAKQMCATLKRLRWEGQSNRDLNCSDLETLEGPQRQGRRSLHI